jgi:hypothetical protein
MYVKQLKLTVRLYNCKDVLSNAQVIYYESCKRIIILRNMRGGIVCSLRLPGNSLEGLK